MTKSEWKMIFHYTFMLAVQEKLEQIISVKTSIKGIHKQEHIVLEMSAISNLDPKI